MAWHRHLRASTSRLRVDPGGSPSSLWRNMNLRSGNVPYHSSSEGRGNMSPPPSGSGAPGYDGEGRITGAPWGAGGRADHLLTGPGRRGRRRRKCSRLCRLSCPLLLRALAAAATRSRQRLSFSRLARARRLSFSHFVSPDSLQSPPLHESAGSQKTCRSRHWTARRGPASTTPQARRTSQRGRCW